MQVTVRFFAAARAAAGVDETVVDVADSITLGELEHTLADGNPELARVLERCSYLRDETALCDRTRRLAPVRVLDVLPPFAGG
ncbi:MoaD/ThiS family protein [Gordonia desulfuricans]|uniref:MoaD/ThiS family protein n=1 Tax=Gordonia desulfuricans TaxID=89051 RepID=A0A7K3LVY7_9ACTN|nr:MULTISPECIES: MoaD/ThiS family protein [Gordonia]EMP10425.1 molybdenum cofactor biosynthesis protein MoaD [Gordonia sp. NB41Y]NDK92422.1 MoaD/ThiS family protein [Gordonia desulfuricans]WLP89554.1 MoaD/ThiS family protein [Gordonia sp. NB41Y]